MAIFRFDEYFPYVLQVLDPDHVYKNAEIRDQVASLTGATPEDQEIMLESKRNTVFSSRVNWAITYLRNAGLLESQRRGVQRLSMEGKQFISDHGYACTLDDLRQYESFVRFITPKPKQEDDSESAEATVQHAGSDLSPEEQIERAFDTINRKLADDLMEAIMDMSPRFFEQLVLDLLQKMGYGGRTQQSFSPTPYSQDGGIDGIIREDELGLDHIYVQAKRWTGNIGAPQIQQFSGALNGLKASKGVFITTSTYTKEALRYVENNLYNTIILIDGERLTELMIQYGVGVSEARTYVIQRLDNDYFVDVDS